MTAEIELPGRYTDHESFRRYMIDDLRRKIFGPSPDASDADKEEELSVSPLQVYSTGVLFPQRSFQGAVDDPVDATPSTTDVEEASGDLPPSQESRSTGKNKTGKEDTQSSHYTEPLNLANEFNPAAAGISFRLADDAELDVAITFGTYVRVPIKVPNPRAGKTSFDGSLEPEFREIQGYKRRHHKYEKISAIVTRESGRSKPIAVSPDQPGLTLHTTRRIQPGDGSVIVSLMIVNENMLGDGQKSADTTQCYFQVDMTVVSKDTKPIFLPIDRDSGGIDDEQRSMELLYRFKRSFCLGHGVAGDWHQDPEMVRVGVCSMVRTSSIPEYELKPIKPRTEGVGDVALDLRMRFLAGMIEGENDKDQIVNSLLHLCADYELWIEQTASEIPGLNAELREAAESHLKNCRTCSKRMRQGIDILQKNEQVFQAFQLMNRAMLMQQFHSSLPPREKESAFPSAPEGYAPAGGIEWAWRPFQLAFILMNLEGMTDPDSSERRIVDLIWFPTGGGKTEAYLGLAAFTILFERMNGRAAGTTVLMRYTLRLLTAQQFQRASALILALEKIRREVGKEFRLGDKAFSIGLWVGESLSPNRRAAALRSLKDLKAKSFSTNPFQVLNCPWCGMEMTEKGNFGYVEHKLDSGEKTVINVCPDSACDFERSSGGLPIVVIDDDIYADPPTLLIGTVDKFAQISWSNDVGTLFGIRSDIPPPVLVIQDELHLISGPLGSMVGLYETAIDRMCSRDGYTHKVVASTATIRSAKRQCLDLYHRDAFEFPPQGLTAGDSYFAYEDTESPGRTYIGVMGTAVGSHQTSLVRACSPLLQSVCYPNAKESSDDPKTQQIKKIVDPYGTLVWYFNSLRELGHAATLCNGDIPEHLKSICTRAGIGFDERRWIGEVDELTSRRTADEIPKILKKLDIPWRMYAKGGNPVDVLLATNMIAVGVDVPRLGLFVMSGQPKSASEYIQATSRVGRKHPGLVVTVYAQSKSRDRSHYEQFVAYHQSLYRYVEPTSVTPFSPPARERGMRGVLVALARQIAGVETPDQIELFLDEINDLKRFIVDRVDDIDEQEAADAEGELDEWIEFWQGYAPSKYGKMGGRPEEETLLYPFGTTPDEDYQESAWPMMTSLRNVDGTSLARVIHQYPATAEDVKAEAEDGGTV